jgi:hypothetical protein
VEQGVETLVPHTGQISVPLAVVHGPESEDQVVVIACAITDGTVDDIEQRIELALSGLFVDPVDDGKQLFEAGAPQDPGNILQPIHDHFSNWYFVIFCLFYNYIILCFQYQVSQRGKNDITPRYENQLQSPG